MSQLIKLRQQIKTIRTIQKITQAMRLVSMSIHSRLNNQKIYLKNYQAESNKITNIVGPVSSHQPEETTTRTKKLIILIGSQKGLCGAFNQDILRKYLNYHKNQIQEDFELMVVGKKLVDTAQRKYQLEHTITKFTPATINQTVSALFNYITESKKYKEVLVFSNSSKNFFMHITKVTTLLSNTINKQAETKPEHTSEPYIWEQAASELAIKLQVNQLKLDIYCLLFDSLISEYAARFRSMDSATRNADTLLETAERQYRKVRQTKITRELVELSAIFQAK